MGTLGWGSGIWGQGFEDRDQDVGFGVRDGDFGIYDLGFWDRDGDGGTLGWGFENRDQDLGSGDI